MTGCRVRLVGLSTRSDSEFWRLVGLIMCFPFPVSLTAILFALSASKSFSSIFSILWSSASTCSSMMLATSIMRSPSMAPMSTPGPAILVTGTGKQREVLGVREWVLEGTDAATEWMDTELGSGYQIKRPTNRQNKLNDQLMVLNGPKLLQHPGRLDVEGRVSKGPQSPMESSRKKRDSGNHAQRVPARRILNVRINFYLFPGRLIRICTTQAPHLVGLSIKFRDLRPPGSVRLFLRLRSLFSSCFPR